MPFIRKTDSQGSQPPTDTRKLFIGRTGELLFFVQNILKPEEPTHNIISIWGQGGVGKSTLLARFIDEAHSADYKDYCLTATVDELQTTPANIMEKFASQLRLQGAFEKALKHYKEALSTLQTERETLQDTLVQGIPTFAGAAVEGVPFVGPLLGEGVKVTAEHLLDKYHNVQKSKEAERLEDSIDTLTRAFVEELNRVTDTQASLSSHRGRNRLLILFFDTFEQLAAKAVPWLLDYFLRADIRSNVVLVIAGRDSIERSIPDDTKRWLPYCDNETIYWIPLNSFTEDETRAYLIKRNITDPDRITTIWQLSQGLPLYLSLLTSNPHGKVDPTADVVANFLRWIPEREQIKRQLAMDASLFSRPFNQDDLAAFIYLPENELPSLYRWLVAQPFVRSQDGRYSYHDLASELFSRHLYQNSKRAYYAIRRTLAHHYQQLLEEIQMEEGKEAYHSAEWLELELALAHQLLLLPNEVSHIKAIEQVIKVSRYTEREQTGEIVRILRELTQELSDNRANISARKTAGYLLHYIESDQESQEFLIAANYLLEKVAHDSTFSAELVASLYNQRGNAYQHLKQYQQALADYDQAITLNPKVAVYYGNRGNTYRLIWWNFERVIAGYELPDLNNADLYNRRGDAYHRLVEDYEQAIADYSQAITLDPSANLYHNRAIANAILKQYEQAIADYSQAITLDPSANLHHNRGNAFYALKQYEQALADFERAIALHPEASRYYVRGGAFYALKQYEQALADFSQAITLYPNDAHFYYARARLYRRLNEFEHALADYNRALELAPEQDWPHMGRGITYLWLKNINQAKADFTCIRELDQTNVYYSLLAEWVEICQVKPDPEIPERLEMMATANPQRYSSYVCRGVAQWLCKAFNKALAELEQAIKLEPEEWAAYFWQGMVNVSLGRGEEAIVALERSLSLKLPPILLAPLCWFEEERPDFYQKYVVPLMVRYDLV